MSAVVINSGVVHYESFGRGTPILFLHGWLGSWRYWMPAMESLAVEHRVYALDLWGFGDSDKSTDRFNMTEYLLQVKNFVHEMGISQPVIVGHALGAAVALELSHSFPEHVQKIVAISLPLQASSIDRRLSTYTRTRTEGLARVFRWKPIPSKEVEQEAARTAPDAIAHSLKSFSTINIIEQLVHAPCDVLLVYGDKDDVIDASSTRELNDALPHLKQVTFAGAKHFPMLDQSSKFNRLLKDFSDKNTSLASLSLKEEWRRRTR